MSDKHVLPRGTYRAPSDEPPAKPKVKKSVRYNILLWGSLGISALALAGFPAVYFMRKAEEEAALRNLPTQSELSLEESLIKDMVQQAIDQCGKGVSFEKRATDANKRYIDLEDVSVDESLPPSMREEVDMEAIEAERAAKMKEMKETIVLAYSNIYTGLANWEGAVLAQSELEGAEPLRMDFRSHEGQALTNAKQALLRLSQQDWPDEVEEIIETDTTIATCRRAYEDAVAQNEEAGNSTGLEATTE